MAKRNIFQMVGVFFFYFFLLLNTAFPSDLTEKELIKQASEKLDAAIIGKIFEMMKRQGLIKETVLFQEWQNSGEAKTLLSMVKTGQFFTYTSYVDSAGERSLRFETEERQIVGPCIKLPKDKFPESKDVDNLVHAIADHLVTKNLLNQPGIMAEMAGKFREALSHYVTGLQSAPEGSAKEQELREKIIKLAQKIQPPPAVPEEVQKHLGRGKAAVEIAKKSEDLLEAISEFKKAARLAPWLANIYFNLGVVQEKAGRFNDAIQSYKLYLLASPTVADAQDVKTKIYGLELKVERQQKEDDEKAARIKREKQKQEVLERFKRLVQGNVYKVSSCSWQELHKFRTGERAGCNETEYGGRNWYIGMGINYFHFPSDGKILLCYNATDPQYHPPCSSDSASMVGTIEWVDISSIRWANNDGKPVWIRFREDWSSFTISPDRPLDDRGYDPSYRYSYLSYKKR